MIEQRAIRIGVAPLFLITLGLTHSEVGVHAHLSLHIYKFGIHLSLSSID